MAFSIKALLQSIFDSGGDRESENEDDGVLRTGSRPNSTTSPSPRHNFARRSYASSPAFFSKTPTSRRNYGEEDEDLEYDYDEQEDEEEGDGKPYEPQRLEGEFNVWFTQKPLGIGLVPSTQLYGTWEVSSIAVETTSAPSTPRNTKWTPPEEPASQEKTKIRRGDVIIAVNMSRKKAQLPRGEFARFLQKASCPLVITFRRPEEYGRLDSRSLATAMFPTSIEYREHLIPTKKFNARASSMQWKRVLQHELARNARKSKDAQAKQLARQLAQDLANETGERISDEQEESKEQAAQPESQQASQLDERKDNRKRTRAKKKMQKLLRITKKNEEGEQETVLGAPPRSTAMLERRGSAELSFMGEFMYTFTTEPIHLTLAPSTRLYGSVEIYDPKMHAPILQVGDVIMSVNGDASVSQWSTDDLMDYLTQLHPPITVCFRRPAVYRKYLETYFKMTKPASSASVATAMFPQTAEYKRSPARLTNKHASPVMNSAAMMTPPLMPSQMTAEDGFAPAPMDLGSPAVPVPLEELREFSSKINETDQFKLWQTGIGKHVQQSRILTERHVRFLWKHLPVYLTCNDMELLYSTRTDGWNLLSFYSQVANKGPTILVIKTQNDNIFGAFCSSSWKQSTGVFGNGRSFVFTLRPRMQVFSWSGLDDSFMYGKRDALFVGGGKKGIALCLQLDEARGFTQPCETFDSTPLAERENFECLTVEVWCFSGLRI